MQLKTTNDIHQITSKLGLTLNESEVYLFLLKRGQCTGAEVHELLGMDKSSCYRALNSLRDKNLVYRVGEERNASFGANDPESIFALIERQREQLNTVELDLNQFLENLKQSAGNSYMKKNVTVIEGIDGYKLYLEDRLRCRSGLIRDISGRDPVLPYFFDYDAYMTDYIGRRVKNKIYLRQLVPFGGMDDKWERSSQKMMKEARELPKGFSADAVFGSWDDKVGIFSQEKGAIVGFIVKDPLITNLMNSMFDFVWNSLGIKL